jgi:hypothetical protein
VQPAPQAAALGPQDIAAHGETAALQEQLPFTQVSPIAHSLSHWPQLSASPDVSTHAVPQGVLPPEQEQPLPSHVWLGPHIMHCGPQCVASLVTQLLPQKTWPPEHIWQGPFWQVPMTPPHSVSPGWHWHEPVLHTCPPTHVFPHPPQLAPSVFGSTHVPLHTSVFGLVHISPLLVLEVLEVLDALDVLEVLDALDGEPSLPPWPPVPVPVNVNGAPMHPAAAAAAPIPAAMHPSQKPSFMCTSLR